MGAFSSFLEIISFVVVLLDADSGTLVEPFVAPTTSPQMLQIVNPKQNSTENEPAAPPHCCTSES